MRAGSRSRKRRFAGAPDGAQQHRDWLSLVEIDGPFLSLSVLRTAWPTLDALDKPTRQNLRIEHAKWQAHPGAGRRDWIHYVLCDLLEWGAELRWNDGAVLDAFAMDVAEHDARIVPAFALIEPDREIKPAATRLLGVMCEPGTHPTARIKGDPWAASAVDRLARLCRFREVQLTATISGLGRIVAITRVSKSVMPVMVQTGQVFSEQIVVFATDDTAMLALLSSAPHFWWAFTRASTLETRVRYTPSDVFETFPLPELTEEMRQLGNHLNEFSRAVMLSRQTGLTKIYNLVFDPSCIDADIDEFRTIHRAIDKATIRAYGWLDRVVGVGGFDHGFHKVGQQIRYTIGPAAQREILDSLLELNHERYAAEVARGLHGKKRKARRRSPNDQAEMFP